MNPKFLILFLTIIYSCNTRNQVKVDYIITKDKDGNIVSEIPYTEDSLIHGTAKFYYTVPKNVIKEEIEFKFGKKFGWHIKYYQNGMIHYRIKFKDNIENGQSMWYYPNGKLEQTSFKISGVDYGSTLFYFKSGAIDTYNCIDSWGNNIYVIKFDTLGNKIKEEGVLFSRDCVVQYTDEINRNNYITNNIVKLDKEIEINITVAQPPFTKTIIMLNEFNKKNTQLQIIKSTVNFKKVFKKLGMDSILIIGELLDSNNHVIKLDSSLIKFTIIE